MISECSTAEFKIEPGAVISWKKSSKLSNPNQT